MNEKLFNFITLRNIDKSIKSASTKKIIVESNKVKGIIHDSGKTVTQKWKLIKAEETSQSSKPTLESISINISNLVKALKEKNFQVSPREVMVLIEKNFEKKFQEIEKDRNFITEAETLKTNLNIRLLTSDKPFPNDLVEGVKCIYLIEALNSANPPKLPKDVQEIFLQAVFFPEYVTRFLNEKESNSSSSDPAPSTRKELEAQRIKLKSALEAINTAIKETAIHSSEEVTPVFETASRKFSIMPSEEEPGTGGEIKETAKLQSFLQLKYAESKKKKLSTATLKILKDGGANMDELSYQHTQQLLITEQEKIITQILEIAPSAFQYKIFWNGTVININDFLKTADALRHTMYKANPYIRPLGIGELKTVSQVNVHYEVGEIAHIENVLKGEKKERQHIRESTTETTIETEISNEESTEHELQTTERHELSTETQKVVAEQQSFDFSVHTDSTFGPWLEVQTETKYSAEKSKEESKQTSSNYAKEIVEKAVENIRKSTREKKTIKTISKISETNGHYIDNSAGTGHTIGLYRWVDKVYTAQVKNHGFRMMYEFIIPEPAAFYIFSQMSKPNEKFLLEEPVFPTRLFMDNVPLKVEDINESNYLIYGSQYKVRNLTPPPPACIIQTENVSELLTGNLSKGVVFGVPNGYIPDSVIGAGLLEPVAYNKGGFFLAVSIGNKHATVNGLEYTYNSRGKIVAHSPWFTVYGKTGLELNTVSTTNTEVQTYAISLLATNATAISSTFLLLLKRSVASYKKWQIETYEKILEAYYELKANYDEKLRAFEFSTGIPIFGNNPLRNDEIQKTELKKHCISVMTQTYMERYRNILNLPIDPNDTESISFPEIHFEKAHQSGFEIQFFEQAFEWPKMMFKYYPYFWTPKENWIAKMNLDDNDPKFAEFLRAGAVRIVLAVRPGYEEAAAQYFQTGIIPLNGDHIGIQDSLFVDIIDELREEQATNQGTLIEEWDVRIPTNLVVIDDDDAIERLSRIMNR